MSITRKLFYGSSTQQFPQNWYSQADSALSTCNQNCIQMHGNLHSMRSRVRGDLRLCTPFHLKINAFSLCVNPVMIMGWLWGMWFFGWIPIFLMELCCSVCGIFLYVIADFYVCFEMKTNR